MDIIVYNAFKRSQKGADAMAERNGRMMMREGTCMCMYSVFPCARNRE